MLTQQSLSGFDLTLWMQPQGAWLKNRFFKKELASDDRFMCRIDNKKNKKNKK
jgi:hypothetical protein